MNINSIFPSKYFRAQDLEGKSLTVTIIDFEVAELEDGRKPILSFENQPQRLILNKSNATAIANAFGQETNSWIGRQIQITTAFVTFMGKTTLGLKVYPLSTPPSQATQKSKNEPVEEALDELPF